MATIYKIYCKEETITDCYVGSTDNFDRRFNQHINRCNNKNSPDYNFKVYKFIRQNGGMENFTIEKIIECDLENKYDKEVEYYLLLNSTLNSIFPRRSTKQYYIDNKKQLTERHKLYYAVNKKQRIERQKEYYAVNKERIQEQQKTKTKCDCGSIIRRSDISAHNKTIKHKNYLSTM